MPLKALIVDDDPLARVRLRKLLAAESDVEIVGECASAGEAIGLIERALPDLVFLDVQMPGLDGFQLLEKLRMPVLPAIIFVTAHDEYALRAFEVHALDYLLKPYSRARFVDALQRARAHIEREGAAATDRRLLGLLAEMRARSSGGAAALETAHEHERLVVKSDGRMFFVRPADIDWVEASANYVRLHAHGESYQFRESMKHMEARLPRGVFVRIHRSAIVNLDRVRELQPWFHGEYVVILTDGTKLTASRAYAGRLRELMR
ncbi:MAG TPA: LytTR family DNA-binding domain-containing protein [Gemmatimonadaceae bacterium]|jgi:Response regulator of the LytR/AlgR family